MTDYPSEEELQQKRRDEVCRIAKAEVNRTATTRIKAFTKAKNMLPAIEEAHRAITIDGKRDSMRALARWLTENGHGPSQSQSWSSKTIGDVLYRADDRAIEHAVYECRTLMSARALSADFEATDVGELEAEYLDIIADALAIGHKIRNERPRSREELMIEAKAKAIEVARHQRRTKLTSMAARERLWMHPVGRKVFEQ